MENPYKYSQRQLVDTCKTVRKMIITMNSQAGQGHTGSDLSETEILSVLYFHVMKYDIKNPNHPDRDRFILSKGHGVGGYYCVLAEAGIFPKGLLQEYLRFESPLPGHPVRQKTPGIEFNTGALGHGLPVAVGLALAGKLNNRTSRIYVLVGDGELQEGSNWEAAMSAAKFSLDNLVVLVDRNRLQLAAETEYIMPLEPLEDKFTSFGFSVSNTDGNHIGALLQTCGSLPLEPGKPNVIIANTTKGKGVSFIENRAFWHHKIPEGNDFFNAIKELE